MATFNVKPDAQLTPNYTGASNGINASPNTAIGSLFEGLSASLSMGVQEADRSNQEQIRNEIFDQVDAIQNEFGVSSATEFQADTGDLGATPAVLNDAGRHLQGLQAQYERGGLKESHYWARMNSMVRQLRGRYPGYRAEIDSMVSSIVGARPANALRSALFNEWEAAANASDQALKDYNSLVDWALKAQVSETGRSYLPLDFTSRQQSGNPYSMTELQSYIQNVQAEEGNLVNTRLQMALENETNNLNANRAERAFRTEATSFVNNILGDTTNALGRGYHDISNQIREAQEAAARGDPQSANMLQTLAPQIAQLQQGVLEALNKKFTESWDGNPNNTYAAHLSNEQRSAIISTAMQPVAILQDAILNDDFGVINSVTAYLQAEKTEDTRQLLDRLPIMNTLQAFKEVAGPDVLGLYLSANEQVQHEISKVLLDYYHLQGGMGHTNITEAFQTGEGAGAQKEYYDGLIRSWQNTINEASSGQLPPEIISNKVNFMFGPDSMRVMGLMTPESRYEYFKKVASPQVTQQMLSLKKSGDVDSWNTYQNWVTSSFINLFQSAVQGLPGTMPDTTGVSVVWDKTTNGFKVTGDVSQNSRANAMPFGLPNPGAGLETQIGSNMAQAQVANLNAAIRVIAPILEENDANVAESLLELFEQMGYNPNRQPEPSVLRSIDKMLGDALVTGLKSIGVIGDTTGTKYESGDL